MVFGATRACRKSALENSESMIGLLINTLPVRLKIRRRDTVIDCLKAMRTRWVSLREHEHTPLSRVQSWSDVPSGQPLFDSIVVFENSHLEGKLERARRSMEEPDPFGFINRLTTHLPWKHMPTCRCFFESTTRATDSTTPLYCGCWTPKEIAWSDDRKARCTSSGTTVTDGV